MPLWPAPFDALEVPAILVLLEPPVLLVTSSLSPTLALFELLSSFEAPIMASLQPLILLVAAPSVESSGDSRSGVGARCCEVMLPSPSPSLFWTALPSAKDESSFLPLSLPNSSSSPSSSSAGLSTMVARGAFFIEERIFASATWTFVVACPG